MPQQLANSLKVWAVVVVVQLLWFSCCGSVVVVQLSWYSCCGTVGRVFASKTRNPSLLGFFIYSRQYQEKRLGKADFKK